MLLKLYEGDLYKYKLLENWFPSKTNSRWILADKFALGQVSRREIR